MKRNLLFILLIAAAALAMWIAWDPAPQAPSLVDTSSRAKSLPGGLAEAVENPVANQSTQQATRESAVAAVEAAAASQDRDRQIALEIETALMSKDAGRRETAFAVLLPELLRVEPARVVDMVARQPTGEYRDALRDEVARQWITRDTEAAVAWLQTLGDERAVSGPIAMRALAAVSPAQAIDVADRLGVGRDDGSVEHILQIWAAESPREARRWLENQPESERTTQMRARLTQ